MVRDVSVKVEERRVFVYILPRERGLSVFKRLLDYIKVNPVRVFSVDGDFSNGDFTIDAVILADDFGLMFVCNRWECTLRLEARPETAKGIASYLGLPWRFA